MILPQRDDAGKQPEPGTLGEQLAAIGISLALAEQHGTTAAMQWDQALQLAKDTNLTLTLQRSRHTLTQAMTGGAMTFSKTSAELARFMLDLTDGKQGSELRRRHGGR